MNSKRIREDVVSVSLPELLQLAQRAKELSLSPLRQRSLQSGQHLSRLMGRGMEFAESRRYHAGDDIRTIDWRVTARTGKPHTKLFAAEKERQVLLCADFRSSMFFATKGVFKSVQTALSMGILAWNAVQTGNRLGGIIFNDEGLTEFRPALGKRGVLPYLQSLAKHAAFSPKQAAPDTASRMDEAIKSIHRVIAPGSLFCLISDFRQLTPYARNLIIEISRHSDVRLCFVYDPLETDLPKNGNYPVTDGKKDLQLNTFNKKNLELYRQKFIDRRDKVASLGHHARIHYMECSTEEDCFEALRGSFR